MLTIKLIALLILIGAREYVRAQNKIKPMATRIYIQPAKLEYSYSYVSARTVK